MTNTVAKIGLDDGEVAQTEIVQHNNEPESAKEQDGVIKSEDADKISEKGGDS